MKVQSGIDVSVLLLFFNRPDHFSRVWDEVRQARPARLFLYQDGPREGRHDEEGIAACRELVKDENIDWECEVHRLYQEKNFGCDPSEYLSQQWAFSQTDKCIVLEDDDVPSQSFFTFCKDMLDRYADDGRVTLISGFNTDGRTTDVPDDADYFFTRNFSIWGWASWSRVVLNWDGDYGFVKDGRQFETLKQKVRQYRQRKDMPAMCEAHAATGKPYYESIFWAYMLLNDGLAIMPRVNLISNIGFEDGTHYTSEIDLMPRRLRKQFQLPRYELPAPFDGPQNVTEFPDYQARHYLRNAWNNPWRKLQYSVEELLLSVKHGKWEHIWTSIKNKITK